MNNGSDARPPADGLGRFRKLVSHDQLVAEFITGASAARTHAVFATEDGETLLVTNSVVNEVAALDAHTGAIQWSVGVGNNPSEGLAANRKFAYVTIRNENKVQAINLKNLAIEGEVAVRAQPDTIQNHNRW